MFEPVFMRLALAVAVAAGASLGLLGVYLAIRRAAFIGLVLANAAAVGSAVAQVFGWPPETCSVIFAVGSALGLGAMRTPRRVSIEAVTAWAYITAASATVLILARSAGADSDTLHLLYGNLLAVSYSHAISLTLAAIGIVVVHILFRARFLLVTFDSEAARVTGINAKTWSLLLNLLIGGAAAMAVHEIGALLTFALLTLPSMAALLIASSVRTTFLVAALLGAVLPCFGLAASFYFDLPAGPAAVAVLALGIPIAGAFRRKPRAEAVETDTFASRKSS